MSDRQSGVSRREAMKLAAVGAIGAAGLTGGPARVRADVPATQPAGARGEIRNIIFMCSDGMSQGVPTLAEPFSLMVRDQRTTWDQLLSDPESTHGLLATDSANSLVTDSAAAASAWGGGKRVNNMSLNVGPDGAHHTPLAHPVRATGRRVGLVTTTRMTHATPAGFAAVHADRNDEDAIAPQFLDAQVDVLMGGGRRHFDAASRKDGRDLIAGYREKGYTFWDTRRQLSTRMMPRQVLGLFHESHLPYTLDWNSDQAIREAVPTLAEMTQSALTVLNQEANGFFLMVEGGRVDHAAHANDAAGILWDQLAFDDAVAVALAFARANHDDTLLVVTSDHGNANPGLNGVGRGYAGSTQAFERVARAKWSSEWIAAEFGSRIRERQPDPAMLIELIREAAGIELTTDEAQAVMNVRRRAHPDVEVSAHHRNFFGMLGQALGNHHGVGWTSVSHTADYCLLTAWGAGREAFHGLLHHVDAHDRIRALLGAPVEPSARG